MAGVPRISSSHLNDHKGLTPLLTMGPVRGPMFTSAPVLRATAMSACLISAALRKRLSGLYSRAVLTTASRSDETAELIRRSGRSANENGGSRRGARGVNAWGVGGPSAKG